MEKFFVGLITSWIAGIVGIVLGVVGMALLVRFKSKLPDIVERAINFICYIE